MQREHLNFLRNLIILPEICLVLCKTITFKDVPMVEFILTKTLYSLKYIVSLLGKVAWTL